MPERNAIVNHAVQGRGAREAEALRRVEVVGVVPLHARTHWDVWGGCAGQHERAKDVQTWEKRWEGEVFA